MKSNSFHLLLLLLFAGIGAPAQTTTVTVSTGADWQDATLIKSLKSTESYMATTNYSTYPRLTSTAWTHSGSQITYRTLIKFDLTNIPMSTVVQSATLYLNSDPVNIGGEISNDKLSGSNSFYIQKVTQAWNPATVTWNNQPASSTTGRIWVAQSASNTENISVSITALVQDMVNNPNTNYGLLMKLENEVYYRSRSYASTDHSNEALHPRLVITLSAAASMPGVFKNAMDSVYQNVNRTPVTTGLLKDYGLLVTDVDRFNGANPNDTLIDRSLWQLLYTSLYFMKFNATGNTLADPLTVNNTIDAAPSASNGLSVTQLISLHFNYEQFKANAVSSNLVYVSNNKIYDTPNRPTSPYEIKTAFCITLSENELQGATQVFQFRPELQFKNVNKTINTLQVDFNDGAGYVTVTSGVDQVVTYTSEGVKNLKFKLTYTDGTIWQNSSQISVSNIAATANGGCTNCRYAPDSPDLELLPKLRTFLYPAESEMNTGEAWIYYAGTDRILDKPLIIVEGFDPKNEKTHDVMFTKDFLGFTIQIGNDQKKFSEFLESSGFDLIYLNFKDGSGDIVRNAKLFENLVQ